MKDIYMTETFHSSPRYCTSALSVTIKWQACKKQCFQNTYEPMKLCKFTCPYAFFCRENEAYPESAQSQKDEKLLIQTIHVGEFPTNMLLPNKVTEKGRRGSGFSISLKGGRVSQANANRNGTLLDGGWVRWGPKLAAHQRQAGPRTQ